MEKELANKILEGNIELHKIEAEFYDQVHPEIFNKSEQKLTQQVLDLAISKIDSQLIKVLDIGTGTGNIALKLLSDKNIERVIGLDLSAEMLDQLKTKIKEADPISLINKDFDSFLSENDEQFDLITISSVLHHLPDYYESLKKVISVLKPGGVLLILHEPTGEKSKLMNILYWLDSRLQAYIFIPKKILKKLKKLNYDLADYHVTHGFDLKGVINYFEKQENLEIFFQKKYNVFKLGIFRLIGKALPKKNNFILGIKKK
jgi:ubiquinone/menaquinone biosynthesis C-methylase UbiE